MTQLFEAASQLVLPDAFYSVRDAAETYASLGLPPVPLYGLHANGTCMCAAGEACPTRASGKHPVGTAWQTRAGDLSQFANHDGNIGIYLASARLVLIDADGEAGMQTLREWNLPATLSQQSGSGIGEHRIYKLAPHHDAATITDRKVGVGLDVKVRGQFVAAPSKHVSGELYRWIVKRPPLVLPDDVYVRIQTPKSTPRPAPAPSPASGAAARARAYVASIPGAISGSGGHVATFSVARALRGWVQKGVSEAEARGLLDEYNARCEPPWSDRELDHKWESSAGAHTVPELADRAPQVRLVASGGVALEAPPALPEPREEDYRAQLMYKTGKNGAMQMVSHTDNVVRILQLDPRWKGKIGFNTFASRIVVASPPFDQYHTPASKQSGWVDTDTTSTQSWMRRNFQEHAFDPSIQDVERAVNVVARTHDYNPLADYLGSISWDGVPRLHRWLTDYLGADLITYTQTVGKWWLISAVARVMSPGCKVDTVPILEGPQGLKKSSALKVLAGPDYFNDTPIDIGNKDAYTAIQGCWFVELAELESLIRAAPSRSKAFFSSGKDRFRRAYAKHDTDELRQCIFVGTINPVEEYLEDPTGARRFLPIKCTKIDLLALERDRDQLWAEAMAEYQEGRLWYPASEEEARLIGGPQEDRTMTDAWEQKIAEYLQTRNSVTVAELLSNALMVDTKDWSRATTTRVGIIMTAKLKWKKRKVSDEGRRVWLYERP